MDANKIFNLLLLTVLTVPTVRAGFHDYFGLKSKAVGAVVLSGVLLNLKGRVGCKNLLGDNQASVVGNILVLSSACVSASYVASYAGKENLSKFLKKIGMQNGPVVAVSVFLATNESTQSGFIHRIPLVGEKLACSKAGTTVDAYKGICIGYGVSKVAEGVALYAVINEVVDKVRDRYCDKDKIDRKKRSDKLSCFRCVQ